MKKSETRTEQMVLFDSDDRYDEIEKFLQRGQRAGRADRTTIERKKLEEFWRVFGIVTRSVLEETGLQPVYLDRIDSLHDGRLYQQVVTLGFLSAQKGIAIVDAVIFSKGSCHHCGVNVCAIPITLLGGSPESGPEIEEIIQEWRRCNRMPIRYTFETYESLPLKCSGGLAVAPWAVATSLYFLEQEPAFIASRVVQYIKLGCEYESIQEGLVGTDLPSREQDGTPRFLIAGYTSNISGGKISNLGWTGENYALFRVFANTKIGLHPRKEEGDQCVITESGHVIIDLDDPSDPCYTFVPYVVVGNEEQSPLRDISGGHIPNDVVTNVDHIYTKTGRPKGASFR